MVRKSIFSCVSIQVLIFIFMVSSVSGQKQADFNGTWIMDPGKSDPDFGKYYSKITCVISQDNKIFSVGQTYTMKDGSTSEGATFIFNFDEEIVKEEHGGTDKYSVQWSSDKKMINLRYLRIMNGNEFGSIDSYSLSPDGSVMTINTTDLKGESPLKQVYNKQ